ncbi:hypothetical protein MRX96_013656 [Rhipicephalus microplus]
MATRWRGGQVRSDRWGAWRTRVRRTSKTLVGPRGRGTTRRARKRRGFHFRIPCSTCRVKCAPIAKSFAAASSRHLRARLYPVFHPSFHYSACVNDLFQTSFRFYSELFPCICWYTNIWVSWCTPSILFASWPF